MVRIDMQLVVPSIQEPRISTLNRILANEAFKVTRCTAYVTAAAQRTDSLLIGKLQVSFNSTHKNP